MVEPIQTIAPNAITTTTTPATTTAEITTIPEIPLSVPKIELNTFSSRLEAEKGTLTGDLTVSSKRKGFSGTGYVTGFTKNLSNSIKLAVDVPTAQHYDITLYAASDTKQANTLLVNGISVGEIATTGALAFEKNLFKGIYLEKGEVIFSIQEDGGQFDLDYILIENNTEIPKITTNVGSSLINKNSDEKTKNIMQFLVDNYGRKTISGQYISSADKTEMELIHSVTGKRPAILMADLREYSQNGGTPDMTVETAIDWGKSGGLVSLMWHWKAPMNEPYFYAGETTFDLSKAVTQIDIAMLSLDEIQKLCDDGKISAETVAVVKDIDNISSQLQKLQEAGVTVLWRPLHEACGGWFWWGSKGADTYKWLWKLMVDRQTKLHSLNNLIWVWNGQADKWYPGDDYCDMVSSDIYTKNEDYSSQVNEFIRLNNIISGEKLIAISEAGTIPDIDLMCRDKSVWSFFGLWYGEYIMDEFGEFSTEYMSREQLIKMYNSEATITLDDLPDFLTYKKLE